MNALESFRRRVYRLENRLFDLRANIDTRGRVPAAQLYTDSRNRHHATAYDAVWCRNLRKLIAESRRLGFDFATFIDIGCGKGRACFYASYLGFSRVFGLDFDTRLTSDANANKRSFRYPADAIEFFVADAAEYLIPDEAALVFMFNPFDAELMSVFLRNNAGRFRTSRSVLAYANDTQMTVLVETGMECLFRDEQRKISLWRLT